MSKKISLLMKLIFFICVISSSPLYAEKIRDLTSIQGIRDNPLIGYGLIVGLDGTGDQSTQVPFTNQSLNNMLSQLGVSVPQNANMHLKNVAAVIVTANLPPFSHTGEKIDVVVSSMGNAKSLKGGTLLMTPLKGTDNQIYAIAQGNILVSEKNSPKNKIHYFHLNQVNSGKIHYGATIEREINNNFGRQKTINLQLNQESFSTAQRISDMINIKYPDTAVPIDSKTIQLNTSANNDVQVHMLSNIQDIDISLPSQEAKVVVNSRTGSIVINQSVKLGSCVISNGNMSIIVHQMTNKKRDLYFLKSFNKIKRKEKSIEDIVNKNYMDDISSNKANLHNIVSALNALGTKPDELMSILQLMKSAGCLNGEIGNCLMNDNLLLFKTSNYNMQFINELKYQVRINPKKYALQTAREVEGAFIQVLLKSMRNSLSQDNLLDNNQSRLYTDIYDQQLSQEISKKGIGLTSIILKQIQLQKNII